MNIKNNFRDFFIQHLWWVGWVPIAKKVTPLAKLPVIGQVIQRVPVSGTYECVHKGHHITYVADKRDLLGRDIFWKGLSHFEPGTLEVFEQYINNETLFIDVGANTGIYSLFALALQAKSVIAFEPIPEIYESLLANLEANSSDNNFLAFNAAVSSTTSTVEFHVPEGSVFATSGSMHADGFRGTRGELVKVKALQLDEVVAEHSASVKDGFSNVVVKIDVEGFEADVLGGMTEMLKTGKTIVVFECHPDGPIDALRHIFDQNNYSISHIDEMGMHPLSQLDTQKTTSGDWNFIALPPTSNL